MDLLFRVSAKRFIEIFISGAIVSLIVTGIAVIFQELKVSTNTLFFVLSALGMLVFIAITVVRARRCYFDLIDRKKYYITNVAAYLAFMIINIILYKLLGKVPYTWMFVITKTFHFITKLISIKVSMLMFHAIMMVVIAAAPVGMDWLFDMDDDEYKEDY